MASSRAKSAWKSVGIDGGTEEEVTEQQNVALPARTRRDLQELAAAQGLSLRQLCGQILAQHAQDHEAELREIYRRRAEEARRRLEELESRQQRRVD
jgi:hypothetical protein